MCSRRAARFPERTDAEVLAHARDMALLVAIGRGQVVRGDGGDTSAFAPHLLDGENVRLSLVALAREDLVFMPLSGPPRLAPRGERLVRPHT